jgi:para-nitrobenzyl esterase
VEKMKVFCGEGPEVEKLSEKMMEIYLAFARNGNPQTNDIPDWPVYDTQTRATMRMGLEFRVEEKPMEEERLFWEEHDM